MSQPTPFHRLFGYSWIDFFEGTDIDVETELDLSIKKQLIDLVIIRKDDKPIPWRLPDGFDPLAVYNLITFKSYQEALDARTIHELIGHYVNYCKRVSPSLDDLLPLDQFRLFAVTVRFPSNLARETTLAPMTRGVYDLAGLGLTIRVIVVNELPRAEHNAMLHLFSAREELIKYAQEHYHPHSPATSTLLYRLLREYSEDQTMSEKLKEFFRQSIDELLKGLPAEERLKGLPAEERLKGLSADEMIQALPPEMLEALKRQLQGTSVSPRP